MTFKYDAELYTLASAETARREGKFAEATAAAGLTADRESVRNTSVRLEAMSSLLETAKAAKAAGKNASVVSALACASEQAVIIHRTGNDQALTPLHKAIIELAQETIPSASGIGKQILGHIILEHTTGRAINGHAQPATTKYAIYSSGKRPTTHVENGRLVPVPAVTG